MKDLLAARPKHPPTHHVYTHTTTHNNKRLFNSLLNYLTLKVFSSPREPSHTHTHHKLTHEHTLFTCVLCTTRIIPYYYYNTQYIYYHLHICHRDHFSRSSSSSSITPDILLKKKNNKFPNDIINKPRLTPEMITARDTYGVEELMIEM